MNEIELVQSLQDDGERVSRPSILYCKDRWEEHIAEMDVAARSQFDFRYEKRLDKVTGKVPDWLRLFDNKEGVVRSELYEDHKVRHQTTHEDDPSVL